MKYASTRPVIPTTPATQTPLTGLIGRESQVVPGGSASRCRSRTCSIRAGGNAAPRRPLFLCLHGLGLQ